MEPTLDGHMWLHESVLQLSAFSSRLWWWAATSADICTQAVSRVSIFSLHPCWRCWLVISWNRKFTLTVGSLVRKFYQIDEFSIYRLDWFFFPIYTPLSGIIKVKFISPLPGQLITYLKVYLMVFLNFPFSRISNLPFSSSTVFWLGPLFASFKVIISACNYMFIRVCDYVISVGVVCGAYQIFLSLCFPWMR